MRSIAARTSRLPGRARSSRTRSRLDRAPMASVRRLQRAAGNEVMGRVLATVAIGGDALRLQRKTNAAPRPTIGIGARGLVVSELQRLLNTAGADPSLAVDGVFGPATHAEVIRFQAGHGLTTDGIVGPFTWAALHGEPAPASPQPGASAATHIGAVNGGGTVPAGFEHGHDTPGTVTHTSTVVDPKECLKQRDECYRCCEELHPWWLPWRWDDQEVCKRECCDFAFFQCLRNGTFPCLCKS